MLFQVILALGLIGLAAAKPSPQDSYGSPQAPAIDSYGSPQGPTCRTETSSNPIPGAQCNADAPQCQDQCSTTYEQKCETKYDQQCKTVNEQKCETGYENKCDTVYEQQCRTEYDQQCNTVYEQVY